MMLKTKKYLYLMGAILSAIGVIVIAILGVYYLVVIMDANAADMFWNSLITSFLSLLIGYYFSMQRYRVSPAVNISMNILFYLFIIAAVAFLIAFIRTCKKIKNENGN